MSKNILSMLEEIESELMNGSPDTTLKRTSDDLLFSPYPYADRELHNSVKQRLYSLLGRLESLQSPTFEDIKDIVFVKLCIKLITDKGNSLTKFSIEKLNLIYERLIKNV
jgi:hypothetical protein